MKKFFKKISLVLAFALVLGSADHATVAKAADTWKFQSASETLYLGSQTVGADTFDFNFSEAPAGYTTSNTFNWSSSNPKVASVEPNGGGVVTAVADGKTTITCRVTNKTTGLLTATASATVTVRTITHATKVEIYNAADASKTPITSAKLVVGETIDLNRQLTNAAGVVSAAGQATNTASTDKTAFKTSDEKVATVDASTGVVTAVKAGTATITAYTYDVKDANKTPIKTATCTITVAADASYTAKQTSVDAFTITFENDVTFDANKLTLYKIFDGEEFVQYVKTTKQTGKDVAVTLYFEFDDEATEYKVVYDGIEQHFTAEIGKAVGIVIDSQLSDPDAVYITNEDIERSKETKLTIYPIDVNGINVASKYSVEYELEIVNSDLVSVEPPTETTDAYITVEETVDAGTAIVLSGTFVVDADEEEVIEFTRTFYALKPATQRIRGVAGQYIDDDEDSITDKDNNTWKSTDLSIALDDEVDSARYLHVMLTDNYGDPAFSQNEDNGEITFASANPNKLLVDETSGQLKTIATGKAIPVVVYWRSTADATNEVKSKAVAIVPVTVTLKRTITKVTSSVGTSIISSTTEGIDAELQPEAITSVVRIEIVDNYGDYIDPANAENAIKVYTKNKNAKAYSSEASAPVERKSIGKYDVTIDGTAIDYNTTFAFVVEVDGKAYTSAGFSVKVSNPNSASSTKTLVTAENVDVTTKASLTSSILGGTAATTKNSKIRVFATRNGVKVHEYDYVYPYTNKDNAAAIIDAASSDAVSANHIFFYEVYLGNAKVNELSYTSTGTESDRGDEYFTAVSGTVGGTVVMNKLAAGTYTVKLISAKAADSNVTKSLTGSTEKTTFKVTDNSGLITLKSTGVELTSDKASTFSEAFKVLYTLGYDDPESGKDVFNINEETTSLNVVAKAVGDYIYIDYVEVTYKPSTTFGDLVTATFAINKTFPIIEENN